MNTVHVLDCTLRDGGYCNKWEFGFDNIKKITSCLVEANVEIIECGFLTNKIKCDKDVSRFNDLYQVKDVIPESRKGKLFVLMMNYGEYDVNTLPEYDGSSIDGIRVAFHKKNAKDAIELCKIIKQKGYKVFIQAMVSLVYSDAEFLSLIEMVNEFEPYAFYIVDSFGMMKGKDLTRLFYVVEHNLKDEILIGFHSHNNMQLAYSNAQTLVGLRTNRDLIIDSSIYGMGRGAGNLNTELFIDYLNEYYNKSYVLKPLLTVIDEVLTSFHQQDYWGYSLPNYISAAYGAHPNYAGYLDSKKTLTIEDMDNIFKSMDEDKKVGFDKDYIEKLYLEYMDSNKVKASHYPEIEKIVSGKTVLVIAPGKSIQEQKELVLAESKKANTISIGVNFDCEDIQTDFIFLSNLRRYRELNDKAFSRCIITSNISAKKYYSKVNYSDLRNDITEVEDNSGLMLIKLLILNRAKRILLAGFDGYSHDVEENYANANMTIFPNSSTFDAINSGLTCALNEYKKQVDISFLTKPKYVVI